MRPRRRERETGFEEGQGVQERESDLLMLYQHPALASCIFRTPWAVGEHREDPSLCSLGVCYWVCMLAMTGFEPPSGKAGRSVGFYNTACSNQHLLRHKLLPPCPPCRGWARSSPLSATWTRRGPSECETAKHASRKPLLPVEEPTAGGRARAEPGGRAAG